MHVQRSFLQIFFQNELNEFFEGRFGGAAIECELTLVSSLSKDLFTQHLVRISELTLKDFVSICRN